MTTDTNLEAPHPELQTLRKKLHSVLVSIATFGPSVAKPPIIDASVTIAGEPSDEHQHQEAVHGLRALRDAVRRDLENIEKCASLPPPSTNAPYLIAVWKEVLLAPQPVIGIWSTFFESGVPAAPRKRGGRKERKEDGVKVDVVADGGKSWIRVNTVKNSRLLAEFREMDSYLTESEEDEEEDPDGTRPSLRQEEFDNSVLRMARPLLAAAQANPVPGSTESPSITIQLTRLDPAPPERRDYDDRIPQTIDALKKLGINVRLGERNDAVLSEAHHAKPENPRTRLQPTPRINLDLSILIALVSDLTHSSLPQSVEDAEARFTPSSSYIEWKRTRLVAQNVVIPDKITDIEHIAKPSRALSTQALQETVRALWHEMQERLSSFIADASVEFWTTPEAVDRCRQIVGKIGGPNERRRVQAMLPSDDPLTVEQQEELFWEGSRYPRGYIPLFPIRLFPPATQLPDSHVPLPNGAELAPFFTALSKTCRTILAQDIMPDPRVTLSSSSPSPTPGTPQDTSTPEDDSEIPRAAVMKANHRLTAHTVHTMLWGASRGWTTLTANKASVKAILREMKTSGNAVWERSSGEDSAADGDGDGGEYAALWVVEPRSLAEGMRSDFDTSSS
ncbi:hypothetical protein EIP91_003471 [Steccherinum ochraceum]|uniref:DUF1308 domain-containing protein n=1 Tax=Steccherinum ochraceum TaxID=92696 RepID=A0A4R0RGT0_9APHY|nr:hypothetical protein EIP91_003471 [Steccherinum ochraceum]